MGSEPSPLFLAQEGGGRSTGWRACRRQWRTHGRTHRLNGIDQRAWFYAGKAEEVLPEYYVDYEKNHGKRARADVIVVDPPRKGCDETLLGTILEMEPERVVYVSCDSGHAGKGCEVSVRERRVCAGEVADSGPIPDECACGKYREISAEEQPEIKTGFLRKIELGYGRLLQD